jgi:hypothetical protein
MHWLIIIVPSAVCYKCPKDDEQSIQRNKIPYYIIVAGISTQLKLMGAQMYFWLSYLVSSEKPVNSYLQV